MKNLLDMSDSDEEDKQSKHHKKKGKKEEVEEEEDGSDSDADESKKKMIVSKNKYQGEDLRKMRQVEKERRETELKKKQELDKRLSLFLGESHGHYKMGNFVRIELQIQKKFSRALIPEYPVILCSLRH